MGSLPGRPPKQGILCSEAMKPNAEDLAFRGGIRSRDIEMNGDTRAEASAVRAMPIRAIRDELKKRGVDMTGCLEKEDLVALLLANWCMVPSSNADPAPSATAAADHVSGSRGGSRPPTAGSSTSQQDWRSGTCKTHAESRGYYICEHCSNKGKMLHCSKCGTGSYCSKECQVACWPEHKKICQQVMEAKERAKETVGTGTMKAFTAWAERSMHLLAYMATAMLWLPAPPLYASHAVYLELHCNNSLTAKPKFAVQSHTVVTLEQLCAKAAFVGLPVPPGSQD